MFEQLWLLIVTHTCWAVAATTVSAAEWIRDLASFPICQLPIQRIFSIQCMSTSSLCGSRLIVVLLPDVLIPAPGNNYNLYENECKIIINHKQTRTQWQIDIEDSIFSYCVAFCAAERNNTTNQKHAYHHRPEEKRREQSKVNINISNLSLCTYRYMSKLFKLFTSIIPY